MQIEVLHTKIAYSERTLICVPCAKFRATEHPIREVRSLYPIEYRHFREHCEDERREHDSPVLLGRGKFLLSDFGEQKICWMTVQNRHNNYFQLEWLEEVVDAMHKVVEQGTGTSARIDSIAVCGKTGTVQNPHGDDHSTFIAFAPKENPKIAIAVFVENGYWGARWAGRIASLMIEKHIKGEITRTDMERFVLNGSLEKEYQKPYTGKPFKINQ